MHDTLRLMRVTFGNLKGGVAKSTSRVHLALGLARGNAQVLLVKVSAGARSGAEEGAFLNDHALPVMDAAIHLWEAYALAYGTVPADLAEYGAVLAELSTEVA